MYKAKKYKNPKHQVLDVLHHTLVDLEGAASDSEMSRKLSYAGQDLDTTYLLNKVNREQELSRLKESLKNDDNEVFIKQDTFDESEVNMLL